MTYFINNYVIKIYVIIMLLIIYITGFYFKLFKKSYNQCCIKWNNKYLSSHFIDLV